jgi:hypothetical protein
MVSGRRAKTRRESFGDVQLTLPNGNVIRGQVLDLSEEGCYVETLESIPANTKLRVYISDDVRRCDLTGTVTRVESGGGLGVFGLAVAFQDMNATRQVAIDAWLTALRALGGKDNDRRKSSRSF